MKSNLKLNFNRAVVIEVFIWLFWTYLVAVIYNFDNETLCSAAVFNAISLTVTMLGFYFLLLKYSSQVKTLDSKTFFVFLTIFLVGYFVKEFSVFFSNLMIKKYFNYGKYQKLYESIYEKDYSLSKYLSRADYSMLNFFRYIRVCWLPFAIKLFINFIRKLNQIQEIEKKNLEFKIGLMKSQINPKFINSSLESIKSLAKNNNELAIETVLKLSNTTRYTLYETEDTYVPIQKELDFIINYFDLKETQLGENYQVFLKVKTKRLTNQLIAPLLFLPIFERAFQCLEKSCEVDINVDGFRLELRLEADKINHCLALNIETMLQRLRVLYPNQHQVEIIETTETLKFSLSIDLTPTK